MKKIFLAAAIIAGMFLSAPLRAENVSAADEFISRLPEKIVFYIPTDERPDLPEIPFQIGKFVWGRYEILVTDTPMDGALTFDRDKIARAVIRSIATGDSIEKFGGGKKSVKKYLTDKKIDADTRKGLPIVATCEGETYMIGGVDIAATVKVTEDTQTIGYFTIEKI